MVEEEGEREKREMGGAGGFQKLKNLGEGSNEGIVLCGLKFGHLSPENRSDTMILPTNLELVRFVLPAPTHW